MNPANAKYREFRRHKCAYGSLEENIYLYENYCIGQHVVSVDNYNQEKFGGNFYSCIR
jgi:hypothetical protein